MEAIAQNVKHGWAWMLFLLIFFFNTFLLPEGLNLILLLAPVWLYLLARQSRLQQTALWLLPLALYVPIHLLLGVETGYYFISTTILVVLACFVSAFAWYINKGLVNLDLIFRDIAIFNFVLAVLSIPLLFSPALKPLVWYLVPISENIKPIPRLKMFTSEASHYSFLLAPVVIYFYSRFMYFKTKKPLVTLFIITVPLVLSFSLGVMLGLVLSAAMVFCATFTRVLPARKQRLYFAAGLLLVAVALVAGYYLMPHNPLFMRMRNIFDGRDTSSRGRTYEAFILAHKVAQLKSIWWGVGPGQLKLLGRSIIINYYHYYNIPSTIRIPNACAETIAYFGYIGFAARMGLEVFLFFRAKVFANSYRLWLFLFVFIYQFTGSYITNTSEYFVWVLAFSNIFPEFSRSRPTALKPIA